MFLTSDIPKNLTSKCHNIIVMTPPAVCPTIPFPQVESVHSRHCYDTSHRMSHIPFSSTRECLQKSVFASEIFLRAFNKEKWFCFLGGGTQMSITFLLLFLL